MGMARMARVVVPGFAHHETQRGNRRQRTFFRKDDYRAYLELMAQWCGECGVAVWGYCLMPNHVHLIVAPEPEDGLRRVCHCWNNSVRSAMIGNGHCSRAVVHGTAGTRGG